MVRWPKLGLIASAGRLSPVRIELHPAAVLGLTFGVILLLGWCAATTSYALFHDKALGELAERHRSNQQSARAEIVRLKTELQRAASTHLIEQTKLQRELENLAERQSRLEQQQEDLAALSRSGDGRAADAGSSGAPPEEHAANDPVLRLRRGYERIEQQQNAGIAEITRKIASERAGLAAAYSAAGIAPIMKPVQAAMGGPFIPLGFGTEASPLAAVQAAAAERDRLRAGLDLIPVGNPAPGAEITSGFGGRPDPFFGSPAFHAGVDMRAPSGTPVHASASGTVTSAGWAGGYGRMIEIRHPNGLSTRYGHLSSIAVHEGQEVTAGAVIGGVGSSGRSTGAHLHYEVRRNEDAVDPTRFLAAGSNRREF